MDKVLKVLAVAVACAVFVTSCGAATGGTTVPGGGGNTSVIRADMKDKTVHMKVGDTFNVELPTIPKPGFNWVAQNLDTKVLMQMGDPVFRSETGGAGGTVVVRFKVVGPGTASLVLIYANSPQGNVPSLTSNTFGMTVIAE
jgi:predicted secreted protein